MKFLVIAMAVLVSHINGVEVDGAEVNSTEVKPISNESSPEKRSIGSILLPLIGGLTGLGNENVYNTGGSGLLGLIGSMLSNRMGLGGGGLKMDFNSKPSNDNHGESSNTYSGSSGSSQGPGIAFNLDFGRIHENLQKGLRIGKAAVSQGGNWLSKMLQPPADHGQQYDPTPMRSAFQEYLPQEYASGSIGPPPRYLRPRAPSSYPVRGSSVEASYMLQSRPKLPKNYASQKNYPEIMGRIKQQQAYMESGMLPQPTYSELFRGSPPRYSDDSLSTYPEMAAESHETYSGIRHSSQQSHSDGIPSGPQSYPEENEISTGNYQRNEYSSSSRPSTHSPYRGNSMDYAESTPKTIKSKNIQQAVAIPISVYEASKNYSPDMGNVHASEYRADYDQSSYGQGSDSRNYEGIPMVSGADENGNYYGSESGSYGGNGQASSNFEQQQ